MSTEMITCPSCGSPMPANAEFCPECGKAHAAYKPDTPDTTASDADTPQGGTPTVNMASSTASDPGQSGSPEYRPVWEPGQYDTRSTSAGSQPDAPAPSQAPQPTLPMQEQAGSSPQPEAQYGAPTQNFSQPGTQPPPVQPYSNEPAPPINYMYQNQTGVAGSPRHDPTVALLLELVGYIWILGIGHIYGGRIGRGIGLMVAYWCYWGIVALAAITVVGIPIACVMGIIWPVVPILSGLWIRNDLLKDNERAHQGYR